VTRFVVLGRERPAPTGRDRTSIAFTFAQDRPGSLAGVLQCFAARGVNCSKIESRPTKLVFGEYVFLVDFEGHQEDATGRAVLGEVKAQTESLKVLGSYPRWSA
jgi:prephenate dehydratase